MRVCCPVCGIRQQYPGITHACAWCGNLTVLGSRPFWVRHRAELQEGADRAGAANEVIFDRYRASKQHSVTIAGSAEDWLGESGSQRFRVTCLCGEHWEVETLENARAICDMHLFPHGEGG